MVTLPRVLVAAPASGHGKTTIAVGIMAALARRGLTVAPAKVGPDYIDPGYHALATGRPSRTLDPWLVGEDLVQPLLARGATHPTPADVAVLEGVMGLMDGRLGGDGFASSAHVATLTRTPVVLVVDISSTSRTVAATVHGLATIDPELDVVPKETLNGLTDIVDDTTHTSNGLHAYIGGQVTMTPEMGMSIME